MTDYQRIHIDKIEGDLLHGHTLSGTEVIVSLLTSEREVDHSYIATLAKAGSQINIIDYTIKDNIHYPQFIVLEPDYLVDVSSIASCCESYGNTHLTHLINRLKPSLQSEAILLGNFASQLLDEEVHGYYGRPYRDSVMDFFRRYTLPLLTTDISNKFHENANKQRDNIHNVFHNLRPHDATGAILEPSFVCEMYGLQGRIDYLKADHTLLIEQKAGLCGWPQSNPDVPIEQTKHAMQMMLYGAVVEQLEPKTTPCTCLLYSKYQHALLQLQTSEGLLHEAMKIRNYIVCSEYTYAREGYGILSTLSPDDINVKGTTSALWTRWKRPEVEKVLLPIAEANDMEKSYYFAMMQFISREHLYSKVGSSTTTNDYGNASKWHYTLEEKLQQGDIYHQLHIVSPTARHNGEVRNIVLTLEPGTSPHTTNFRCGDIVILYPYAEGTEPDVRKHIVYRCTLSEITPQTLTLTLRAPQKDANVLLRHIQSPWAIEHDFMESSYSSCYRALHAFLSIPRERKDMLLLRRKPRVDTSFCLKGEYGEFNPLVLKSKQARELFLLIGPPGTGKTSFGLMSILHEELASSPSSATLLLAYTNRAVDEICSRLVEAGLNFVRIGNPHTCAEEFLPYLLDTIVTTSTSLAEVRCHMEQTRIVVGTATTLGAHNELFTLKNFTLAIVDEASQILEPHILGILSAMHKDTLAVERFVLIGDHKQLPAVVKQSAEESRIDDPLLHQAMLTNCRESLFERMLKRYGTDPSITYMLHRQGRMHHDIAMFPNNAFYKGMLTEAKVSQKEPLPNIDFKKTMSTFVDAIFSHRVAFIDTPYVTTSTNEKSNTKEAVIIATMAAATYRKFNRDFATHRTLGIIVPYRNQIATIRKYIEQFGIAELNDITIDTVERFQGSQRDVIIYGFTAHNSTQIDFLTEQTFIEDGTIIDRKLNVVMTRARHHLFMVGNATLLEDTPIFNRLITFIRTRKEFAFHSAETLLMSIPNVQKESYSQE